MLERINSLMNVTLAVVFFGVAGLIAFSLTSPLALAAAAIFTSLAIAVLLT